MTDKPRPAAELVPEPRAKVGLGLPAAAPALAGVCRPAAKNVPVGKPIGRGKRRWCESGHTPEQMDHESVDVNAGRPTRTVLALPVPFRHLSQCPRSSTSGICPAPANDVRSSRPAPSTSGVPMHRLPASKWANPFRPKRPVDQGGSAAASGGPSASPSKARRRRPRT